jgi:hypothetical protein
MVSMVCTRLVLEELPAQGTCRRAVLDYCGVVSREHALPSSGRHATKGALPDVFEADRTATPVEGDGMR